jgi:hypothetical protein
MSSPGIIRMLDFMADNLQAINRYNYGLIVIGRAPQRQPATATLSRPCESVLCSRLADVRIVGQRIDAMRYFYWEKVRC